MPNSVDRVERQRADVDVIAAGAALFPDGGLVIVGLTTS
jgi:hypothetical protein